MSTNMLIVLGSDNNAYVSGIDKWLELRKVKVEGNQKIVKVGCYTDNFMLMNEDK